MDMILACDSNGGIGIEGKIPWNIPEDLRYFKSRTMGHSIVMGRRTYQSIGNKLFGRNNIVITSQPWDEQGITFWNAPKLFEGFIIGGAEVYNAYWKDFKNCIRYVYLTLVNGQFKTDIKINFIDELLRYDKVLVSRDNDYTIYCITINNNNDEKEYLSLAKKIIQTGSKRLGRNGTTFSLAGNSLRFNLSDGRFPILTTKFVPLRLVFEELMFFLRGQTNSKILEEKGVNIWKPNSTREFLDSIGKFDYSDGELGPMYGFNWKYAGASYPETENGFNQIKYCLELLKKDPFSRRIIMTTFIPHIAQQGVLYPCHGITVQFYVDSDEVNNYLTCMMYQRSVDYLVGLPFNITSYALLVNLFCETINCDPEYRGLRFKPKELIMFLGDTHIYEEHIKNGLIQISRTPFEFPIIKIKGNSDIEAYEFTDLEINGYKHQGKLEFVMKA